ncbi:hypothetical protein EHS39_24485 [Ensifer sp. MPMI2T]|nr:hypothetical protein EHS39_24485 [Ensifer sp. MPMI2T]
MIENYRTGFLWQLMKKCPFIVEGCAGRDSPVVGCTYHSSRLRG